MSPGFLQDLTSGDADGQGLAISNGKSHLIHEADRVPSSRDDVMQKNLLHGRLVLQKVLDDVVRQFLEGTIDKKLLLVNSEHFKYTRNFFYIK